MNVVALDTYEVAKELRAAGFSEEQAEALTRAMRRAQDVDLSNLSTKADLETHRGTTTAGLERLRHEIELLRSEVKADLEAHRAATKSDFADLKHDVERLRSDVRGDVQALRAEIQASKSDTIKWVIGIVGFQTVAIIGALVTLTRGLR